MKNVDLKFIRCFHKDYIGCIEEFPNRYFDVIFIDGADNRPRPGDYRVRMVQAAVDKLKNYGLLVIDNSETLRCRQGVDFLRHWVTFDTFNGKWSTSIYVKPKGAKGESFRNYLKSK